MGKRLRSQRRGSGSPKYVAPSHRYLYKVKYRPYDDVEKSGRITGKVISFVRNPAHSSLLMKVLFENGDEKVYFAPEGIQVGDVIEEGTEASIKLGSVLPLSRIPEGAPIFNIELRPGDGGRLVRSSGSVAFVRAKEENGIYVKMPSRRLLLLSGNCRAQLGCISMGGRPELPLMKAGNAYYKMRARNKVWPTVRGVAMNPVNHPFGGKEHHPGKGTAVARNAPPGRKVGHIAARTTGRRTALKDALKEKKGE